jgi:hypothetical protein
MILKGFTNLKSFYTDLKSFVIVLLDPLKRILSAIQNLVTVLFQIIFWFCVWVDMYTLKTKVLIIFIIPFSFYRKAFN